MNELDELRGHGRMTWIEAEQGWLAAPEEIVNALSRDGFEEREREMTNGRRHGWPAGGAWHGVNKRTGVVASATWVNRLLGPPALVFITMDGQSLRGDTANSESDSRSEDGGEA
jgi:hypothetical protein